MFACYCSSYTLHSLIKIYHRNSHKHAVYMFCVFYIFRMNKMHIYELSVPSRSVSKLEFMWHHKCVCLLVLISVFWNRAPQRTFSYLSKGTLCKWIYYAYMYSAQLQYMKWTRVVQVIPHLLTKSHQQNKKPYTK